MGSLYEPSTLHQANEGCIGNSFSLACTWKEKPVTGMTTRLIDYFESIRNQRHSEIGRSISAPLYELSWYNPHIAMYLTFMNVAKRARTNPCQNEKPECQVSNGTFIERLVERRNFLPGNGRNVLNLMTALSKESSRFVSGLKINS